MRRIRPGESNYDYLLLEERERRNRKEREAGYPNSWRVFADGKIISHSLALVGARMSEAPVFIRLERYLYDHLLRAQRDPEKFRFHGYATGETGWDAERFLKHHRERSGVPLDDIRFVPPGPTLQEIIKNDLYKGKTDDDSEAGIEAPPG